MITNERCSIRWGVPLLVAAGLGLAVSAAAGNSVNAAPAATAVVSYSYADVPIESVKVTRAVNYADLDLTTRAGFAEFLGRVRASARAACEELYRLQGPQKADECARKAVVGTLSQMRLTVAAARERSKAG